MNNDDYRMVIISFNMMIIMRMMMMRMTLQVGDAGEYRCEVDIMGRPLTITHTLEVMVAPQVQLVVV